MIEYALLHWKMAVPPVGSKASLLDQLKHIKKVTGKTPSQLQEYEAAKLPSELSYIYTYFLDFYNGEKFSYTELQAWQNFVGFQLSYVEAELIRQLCLERLSFDYSRQQEYIQKQQNQKRS